MTNYGARIKHPKLRGEWAELCFMVRAAEHGLQVSKPWGEAYLILENSWYIIPAEMIRGQGSIAVYPRLKKSEYARYREAWHLLRGGAGNVRSIEACAEPVVGYAYGAETWVTPCGS